MNLQTRLTKRLQTMSVWKREIFKWSRSDSEKDQQYDEGEQPLVVLGTADPANEDLKQLLSASIHGRKKDIVEVLQKGIWVDFPNDAGQTALFCATLHGHHGAADILLQNGANPNERSNTGMTPVHVACLKGSLKFLGAMIECGGDLRLHDNEGNGCMDWAKYNPDPKRRMKVLEFLQKSQLFAHNYSGDFVGNTADRQPSILQMLRGKVSSQMSLELGQDSGLRKIHNHGYGRVYYGGESASGIISVIPLLTERQLRQDADGIGFDSASGFVMTGMLWNMTPITVKQPSRELKGPHHHSVDLLISEVEHLSKLRHPNILLLMGLCQSSSFDKLMLAFERVSIGSLHFILHEKIDHLPMTYIRDICNQVCQALLYIQGQNYLHCSLSSHAVFMVSMHQAKVGNLEYMVEMKKASTGRTCLAATSPHREHIFRWMAPEIMMESPPCAASDVYSFCCILWEMVTSELPWKSTTEKDLLELHKTGGGAQLPSPKKTVALFQTMIEEGLRKDPGTRPRDFFVLLRWLQGPLDKVAGWKPSTLDQLKSLQRESTERISLSSHLAGVFASSGTMSASEGPSSFSQQSESSQASSSSATVQGDTSDSFQPITAVVASKLPNRALAQNAKRNSSDITNNYSTAEQQKQANLSNSCSTTNNGKDDLESETVDGCSSMSVGDDGQDSRCSRKRFEVRSAGQVGLQQLDKDTTTTTTPRNRFDRSRSFSTVTSSHQKYFQQTASLPGSGSRGRLRDDSTSPFSIRSAGCNHWYLAEDSSPSERSKTLPLVKPASHLTAIQEFSKDSSAGIMPTWDVVPRRSRRLSPRRSLPMSRNDPNVTPRCFPRSKSASGDVIEKDVELSVPGSVRTLTEQFQAYLYNHSLRQSILKGSMTPQGSLFEDLDTSPISLKQTPEFCEIPPEGSKQKQGIAQDKEVLTVSSKASTESLTSVSFREESTPDEDEDGAFPISAKNELDITEETPLPKPSAVYPPYPVNLCYESTATPNNPRIFQRNSAFRKFSKQRAVDIEDCMDGGNPEGYYDIPLMKKSQFLPSSLPGTDVSSHPFDFQDYYIDDDFTETSGSNSNPDHSRQHTVKNRDCEATHITDRSRQRVRKHVWLGDNNKTEQGKRLWFGGKNKEAADYAPQKTQPSAGHIFSAPRRGMETQDRSKGYLREQQAQEWEKQEHHRKAHQNLGNPRQKANRIPQRGKDSVRSHESGETNTERFVTHTDQTRETPPTTHFADWPPKKTLQEDAADLSSATCHDERDDQPGSKKAAFLQTYYDDAEPEHQHHTPQDAADKHTWDTNRARESRWEEFVRHTKLKESIKEGSGKENFSREGFRPEEDSAKHALADCAPGFKPQTPETAKQQKQKKKKSASDHSLTHSGASFMADDDDDDPLLLLPASGESSVSTVVEKPRQNLMSQSFTIKEEEGEEEEEEDNDDNDNDHDNDNDTTLIPEEAAEHPRCILLHVERTTLLPQEEPKQPKRDTEARSDSKRTPTLLDNEIRNDDDDDNANDNDTNDDNDDNNDEVDYHTVDPKRSKPNSNADATGHHNRQRVSPSQQDKQSQSSTLRKFYLGSPSSSAPAAGSQGYTTTLKVESSLRNPGTHHITHTAHDLETGLTQTVHEETVQADTLKTTVGIQ